MRTGAFYNLKRQILKCLAGSFPQLTFIVTGSDLFNRSPYTRVKRIAVGWVWSKKLSSSHRVFLAVCDGAESCWDAYGLPAATSSIQGLTATRRTFWYISWFTLRPSSKIRESTHAHHYWRHRRLLCEHNTLFSWLTANHMLFCLLCA